METSPPEDATLVESPQAAEDSLFGQIAVANKLLTRSAVAECVQIQLKLQGLGIKKRLGEIILERGLLPQKTIHAILEVQRKRQERPIPEIEARSLTEKEHDLLLKLIAERGLVPGDKLDECVRIQFQLESVGVERRLGDLLLDKGYVDPSVVDEVHRLEDGIMREANKAKKVGKIKKVDASFDSHVTSKGWIPPDKLAELKQVQRELEALDIFMSLDDIALHKGYLTQEQTATFRLSALQDEAGGADGGAAPGRVEKGGGFLGEVMVSEGFMSPRHLNACVGAQQKMNDLGLHLQLGEIAVAKGYIQEADLPRILELQRQRRLRTLGNLLRGPLGWAVAGVFAVVALLFAAGILKSAGGPEPGPEIKHTTAPGGSRDGTEDYLAPPRYVQPGAGKEPDVPHGKKPGPRPPTGGGSPAEDPEEIKRALAEKEREAAEAARLKAEAAEKERAEAARRAEEAKKAQEAKAAHDRAAAELEETLAEIEPFVRTFRYRTAIEEYARVREVYASWADLVQRIRPRAAEIYTYHELHERLKEAINTRKLRDPTVRYGPNSEYSATIDSATDEGFQTTFKGGASTLRWVQMKPVQMFELLERMDLSIDDLFTVAGFCLENGLVPEAHKLLIEVGKREPARRGPRDTFLAQRTGAAVPPGGFVAWQGRLVSQEEKANREKGLLQWAGLWITHDELVQYAQKGYVKQGSKWIPKEEADLLKQGYRKYKDKWYTKGELAALHANWEDAWELETDHYAIRTNCTEEFMTELAAILEEAYRNYKEFFGKEPGGKKMNIYAFRAFEDFRNWCIQEKMEGSLRAHGFAIAARNYGCGYDALNSKDSFLSTMVHEGCHLFHGRTFPSEDAPSWYHEGMATNFEGYRWDGKKLTLDFVSKWRLPWIQQALKTGNYLPLADFLDGDAGAAINKGVSDSTIFYSEAWSFYYFLNHTTDPDLKAKYEKLRHRYDTGGSRGAGGSPAGFFKSIFGDDLGTLEAAWKDFISKIPG